MSLTDTAIRTAKPREKSYKISDGHGLAQATAGSDSRRILRSELTIQGRHLLARAHAAVRAVEEGG